ncbi:MAG TPA: efflux RND transporter periplasmic adaptor subunit [Gammaproteobacteria bacterium]
MKKRMIIAIAVLVVVFGGIFGWKAFIGYMTGQYFANYQPPPVTVSATEAELESWQPRIEAVGSLSAVQGVDVAAEVSGVVEEIFFKSGEHAEKGELLVQLDDTAEQAELPGLRARAKQAKQNLERTRQIVGEGLAAEEALDAAQSEYDQANSTLRAREVTIEKKAIRAPFAGQLGIRQVDVGAYVQAGDPIVTLQSLDPLYINFTLPQQRLGSIEPGQVLEISTDAFSGKAFTGKVTAISPKVDPSTRNFSVQGQIDNPEGRLRPGMFVEVEVLAGNPNEFVTVPRTAISYSLYGDAVFVVTEKDDKLIAEQRFIETGPVREGDVAILSGLEPGESVVTAGQLKLQDGATLLIDNDVQVQE